MPHALDQRLCLEFLTAVDLDAPSFVSLAAQHGFRRISLLVNQMSPPYQDFDLLGNSATRQETRRRCEDLGIAVDMIEAFNIQADTNPLSFVPALESGAVLGRPVVNLLPRDDDEGRIADGFAGACALADRYGFPVMTEISRRATLKTLPQAVSFFKRIGRTDLRVVLDTLHFFRFGGTLDQVREYRDWIGRIQISDGPADMPLADQLTEARQRRLIPGDGALPLRELLAALNPGLTIGIEVPNPDFTTDERVRRSREATLALMSTVKHA